MRISPNHLILSMKKSQIIFENAKINLAKKIKNIVFLLRQESTRRNLKTTEYKQPNLNTRSITNGSKKENCKEKSC